MRWLLHIAALLCALGLGLIAWGYRMATADPIVRRAAILMPDWPQGMPPHAMSG